jgi:hypothetical protein
LNCTSYNTTYGESTPDANSSALLHFNENSGNIAYDESSNGNDGTIINATWTTGRFGNALEFSDAVDDYVRIPHSTSLNITDEITLMAWIYPYKSSSEITVGQNIVNKGTGTTASYRLVNNKNVDKLRFGLRIDGTWQGCDSIELVKNNWYHIAGTYNGTDMVIYVNGQPKNICNRPGSITTTSDDLYIGTASEGRNGDFDGKIDEVHILNRALSEGEIADEYYKTLEYGEHDVTVYAQDAVSNLNSTTRYFTVMPPPITITAPLNGTISDNTPNLNLTTRELANITYSWDNEGNISGCLNCTSYNTTYGEYANSSEKNLILLMHFNENYWDIIYDDSGNGHTGTIQN